MQLVNIQTLAFTPPHTLPWRVYLYTHTQQACSADTSHSTLILGELLYTGESQQREGERKGTADGQVGMEGGKDEQLKEQTEPTAGRLGEGENGKEEGVKVTLLQKPRDDDALDGFVVILTTVLHTLASGRP